VQLPPPSARDCWDPLALKQSGSCAPGNLLGSKLSHVYPAGYAKQSGLGRAPRLRGGCPVPALSRGSAQQRGPLNPTSGRYSRVCFHGQSDCGSTHYRRRPSANTRSRRFPRVRRGLPQSRSAAGSRPWHQSWISASGWHLPTSISASARPPGAIRCACVVQSAIFALGRRLSHSSQSSQGEFTSTRCSALVPWRGQVGSPVDRFQADPASGAVALYTSLRRHGRGEKMLE
jgi:hypothetical protein